MTWKYVGDGSWLTGVPSRDENGNPHTFTDDEFEEYRKAFDEREGKKGLLEKTGLYAHTPDRKTGKEE